MLFFIQTSIIYFQVLRLSQHTFLQSTLLESI